MIDRHDGDGAGWRVLTAVVPVALEDEIAAVLGGGSLGVEVAPAGAGKSAVRVYLGTADDAEAWRLRAARILVAHGLEGPSADVAILPVANERWVERWQASLRPIPLGERFVVVRGVGAVAPEGRETLRLLPGMAFGTGEHETTRMCAAAVERRAAPGSRWLDVGTGTGILAVVAARCGASRVVAVDVDPEAAHVASETVAANDAAAVVEVRVGSIGATGGERFDGLVANVQSSFFLAHGAELAAALVSGGALIASGVLAEDLAEIAEALARHGLSEEERSTDGPWGCLIARRRS